MKTLNNLTRSRPILIAATLLSLCLATASAADLRLGLVSYWPLDANNGGTTPDLASGNDMTVNNTPSIVSGQRSNAFSFNGTSQYLGRTHDISPANDGLPIYLAPGGYTIAMWVKGAPQTAANRTLFCMGNSTNNSPLAWLETDPTANGNKLGFYLRTTAGTAIINHLKSAAVVLDNTWHHIAWVDNKGAVKLYVDGVLDAANFSYTPAVAGSFLLNLTTIGALARGAAANYFTGAIDDVAVWERTLTQEEIEQVRTNAIPTPIPPAAPAFIQPPVGSTNAFGDRAYFSAAVIGSHPLTYQWFKDGTALLDQTSATLVLNYLTTIGTNEIAVVASNAVGSVTNAAPLVVLADPPPNLAEGLVSYWPLNEVTNVPPTTPDLYNRNDMVLTNMDSGNLVDSSFGKALTFDGVEECGTRAGGWPIYNNSSYSVALWVKGAVQPNRGVYSESSRATATPLVAFLTEASGFLDNFVVLIRNDANTALVNTRRSTRSVFDDQWHHIVWTDQNGIARLYIDGVLDETEFSYTRTGTFTLNTTALGALVRNTTANYFTGSVDDVAQWHRRLTWTEIQQTRTNGIPAPVAPIPPEIILEPVDLTNGVLAGDTVSFSVRALGPPPLSYQWRSSDIAISLVSNPTAGSDVLTLTNVQPADGAGFSVVITNVGGAVTSRVAQLLVTPYTPATTGDILKLDFGLTGSPAVQPGFSEMNLAMNGTNFNGVKVTVSPIGGASLAELQERLRPSPEAMTNNPPNLTQAQVYNDLLFVNNTNDGRGMSILIERLAPNTPYGLTIWSWTTQSGNNRISDWIETASGTNVTIKTGYIFNTLVAPTNDFDSTFGALLTSSAAGTLRLEGRKNGGGGQSVLVNALRLVAQPVIRITKAQLVNGNIRLTSETQYPGQPISLQQRAALDGGTWSPASGGGIIETHGPVAIAEFPASANQLFYRVISP